jgi:hypothetical protein
VPEARIALACGPRHPRLLPHQADRSLFNRPLELVLGQLRAQVAAALLQSGSSPARLLVDRMLSASVRAPGHRERVLPAGQMSPQLGRGGVELRPQAVGHRLIEPRLRRVLGDPRAQVGDPLANRAVLRMVHRERVLPRSEERIELGAQSLQVGGHEYASFIGPAVPRERVGIPTRRLQSVRRPLDRSSTSAPAVTRAGPAPSSTTSGHADRGLKKRESPGGPGLSCRRRRRWRCRRHRRRSSGGGIRTRDLRVMSPTSYLTAPPRVATKNGSTRNRIIKRRRSAPGGPSWRTFRPRSWAPHR